MTPRAGSKPEPPQTHEHRRRFARSGLSAPPAPPQGRADRLHRLGVHHGGLPPGGVDIPDQRPGVSGQIRATASSLSSPLLRSTMASMPHGRSWPEPKVQTTWSVPGMAGRRTRRADWPCCSSRRSRDRSRPGPPSTAPGRRQSRGPRFPSGNTTPARPGSGWRAPRTTCSCRSGGCSRRRRPSGRGSP